VNSAEPALVLERFLRAADSLYNERHKHAAAIAASTGLSEPGVLLGFEALERACSVEETKRLCRAVPAASVAYVLLSANVFVAPFRALLLARLGSPRVVVRPSSRDPYFAGALVQALGDPAVTLDAGLKLPKDGEGMVHLYGSDDTLRAVRADTHLPVWGHGTGFGAAFIASNEITEAIAAQSALDVIMFDQRGCLSPKVVFVEGGEREARAFAEHLHKALAASPVPRGELHPSELAQITHFAETMHMAGDVHVGHAHLVAVASEGAAVLLPPAGRTVLVLAVPSADLAAQRLDPFARYVTSLGVSSAAALRTFATRFPRARLAALGAMQRPPLDGPVDLRTADPVGRA
jgi:hypothetical protein